MSILSSTCAICTSCKPPKSYRVIDGLQLWRCHSCSTIFLDPTMKNVDQEFIIETKAASPTIEYWSTPVFYSDHSSLFEHYFIKRLKMIKRFGAKRHSVLDIGCGHGYWLEYLQRLGHEAIGIDLSHDAYQSCSSRGLKVEHIDFAGFHSNDKFTLISACDVLEHVTAPLEFLKKCNELLTSEGLIYLQVPDVFGPRFPLNHNPLLPHHRWHFKFRSLQHLLKRSGFEVLHHSTGILGVVGEQVKRGRIPVWMRLYWKLAAFFKVGNRLQIIAKKVEQ